MLTDSFVPPQPGAGIDARRLFELADLLAGRRVALLAGAGCSTESGIPDYRSPRSLARRTRAPMQYREFTGSAEARRRYWARSAVGWSRVAGAQPNPAHHAVAALDRSGITAGLITQNVDGLDRAAGTERVVELHGSLHRVRCLDCGTGSSRVRLQQRLQQLNPRMSHNVAEVLADGDAELPTEWIASFRVPTCEQCGGVLKPDVVFFGEGVPAPRVERALGWLDEADALLVAGSSLTVFSGYRFVRRARQRNIPVGIVNIGPTRADAEATVKLEARVGRALPRLADLLGADD